MPTNTLGSPNISVFDIKLTGDLCIGKIVVDATPSVFINAANVLGVKIKITNPFDVVIKTHPSVGYDITNPFTANIQVDIPTVDNTFEYGNYIVEATVYDAGGKSWVVKKPLNICQPNANNKALKYGEIKALIEDDCNGGKAYVKVNEPPVYKGFLSESKTQSYIATYPSSSLLPPITVTSSSFSLVLFQGEYIVKGDVCATYNALDNVYYKIPYKVNCSKTVKCLVDMCAVADRLAQFDSELNGCSEDKTIEITNKIIDTLRLLSTIEWARKCGKELSSYIEQLEVLLGCTCTCSITDGTPIVNNAPARDIVIQGCGFTKTTNGLTDTYTLNNHSYTVTANPLQNIISISAPQLNGCEYTQQIEFDIANLNTALKAQIINIQDWADWSNIVKKGFIPNASQLICLGVTLAQWNALDYQGSMSLLVNKLCSNSLVSTCNAVISNLAYTRVGADIVITWDNDVNTKKVDIFLNGDFVDSVLSPIEVYTIGGAANGNNNTLTVRALCDNDVKGNELELNFQVAGCPFIAKPLMALPPLVDYPCPFDGTTLEPAPMVGITLEWHNANNTNNGSLILNPTILNEGIYYVFAKDVNGCYSLGQQVIIACKNISSCTAPQNPAAVNKFGDTRISFNSAAYPPPANSYTVKRRLSSAADISGNYTTIGNPTYNGSLGEWEILDTTALANTLYTYKVISNCTSGEQFVFVQYAKITCPIVTTTPTQTTIPYSFVNVGGQVDKYEIELYDSLATTLITGFSHVPVFANPITGTMSPLTENTNYVIRIRVFIGAYFITCDDIPVTTLLP